MTARVSAVPLVRVRSLAACVGVWLLVAGAFGGAARAQTFSRLFDESFADNSRGWALQDDANATMRVAGGYYEIAFRGAGGKMTWRETPMDTGADYFVQAALERRAGPDGDGYGVTWGGRGGDCYYFIVTGSGHFQYGRIVNQQVTTMLGWMASAAVRPGNAANLLEVYRKGGTLYFYVNEEQVASAPAEPLYGTEVGLWVESGVTARADYLVLSQPPRTAAPAAAPAPARTAGPVDLMGTIWTGEVEPGGGVPPMRMLLMLGVTGQPTRFMWGVSARGAHGRYEEMRYTFGEWTASRGADGQTRVCTTVDRPESMAGETSCFDHSPARSASGPTSTVCLELGASQTSCFKKRTDEQGEVLWMDGYPMFVRAQRN